MSQDLNKIVPNKSPFYLDFERDSQEAHSLFNDPWLHKILIFIFWTVGLIIFILLEFGLVYLTISGIIAIFKNTRNKIKLPGELSAYSVFNPNQEKIQGTFDDKDMLPVILVS